MMFSRFIRVRSLIALPAALVLSASAAAANEPIKIGVIKGTPFGPFFIARDKGYFGAEGLGAGQVF